MRGLSNGSRGKESSSNARDAGDVGSIPGSENPLEEEMLTHLLAWRIPWSEEVGGLESMWSQRVRLDWETEHKLTL